MKIKKKSRFLIGAFFATAIFVSCASSPEVPTNTFDDDIALILRNFVPYEGFADLPESCKLADGQAPRVIPSTGKAVASMRELQQKLQQIEDQNFYRAVGEMRGSQRDSIKYNSVVTESFANDVMAACQELKIGMALWEITKEDEKTEYHAGTYTPGYYSGNVWISGRSTPGYTTTSYNREWMAYFLTPIPKTDKDAWMLGLNVRDLEYEDRERLSRNTGVLVTNVYDGRPAFNANVRPDYVITGVNDKTISTMEDWLRETQNIKAGEPVKLTTAHYGHGDYFTETITPIEIPPEEIQVAVKDAKSVAGIGNEMVFVEGGSFLMGDNSGSDYEIPVHKVTVNSFYISNHEVTQAQWNEVMLENPSYCKGSRFDEAWQPVERITWEEAIDYCNKRSDKEGLERAYKKKEGVLTCDWDSEGYRLPTEAEWEFVARGGKNGKDTKYAGSNSPEEVAWFNMSFARKIMQKNPNKLGIYDLTGNVAEWCWDRYGEKYYAESPEENPTGPRSGKERVYRGNYFIYTRQHDIRQSYYEVRRYKNVGLRVVRTVIPQNSENQAN